MNDLKFRLERVRSHVSDEEIIADIRQVADLLSTNVLSFRKYKEMGNYAATNAALRFDTWNGALVAAGLAVACERNIAAERLFENLMRLWEHYGRSRASGNSPALLLLSPTVLTSADFDPG